jgi:hypothetical protein
VRKGNANPSIGTLWFTGSLAAKRMVSSDTKLNLSSGILPDVVISTRRTSKVSSYQEARPSRVPRDLGECGIIERRTL